MLEDEVGKLAERLDTVLVPSPPTSAGTEPGRALTSHVRGRLESLLEKLRDIQTRLEI
ncbi:MAG: hypothetical protein ABR603_01850 [Pyrinomonadaceae bacterium]